ncbi:MAG: WYL domain-containing protein [Rhodobacteraceae bacterium]|nr:WYL domain-containing protein [Paracoccaceae bacterium]
MSRSDRLLEMVQILRDGRVHLARDMAARLGVTPRTIYRDMEALMSSGVPVRGTKGLGYAMMAPVTLPPLNLTMTELEALHLGLAIVGDGGDEDQRAAAASLSAKIDAVLPADRDQAVTGWGFAVYPFADAAAGFTHMPALRAAIRARQKLRLKMTQEDKPRTVRPLELTYWGRVWTVTCWCETTRGFQTLRADLIDTAELLPELFVDEIGKTLVDFRANS